MKAALSSPASHLLSSPASNLPSSPASHLLFPLLLLLLISSSSSSSLPDPVDQSEIVLASSALRQYMSSFIQYYKQREEGEGEQEEQEEVKPLGIHLEEVEVEEEQGFEYYDIETSEETKPNVNWTMLTPR